MKHHSFKAPSSSGTGWQVLREQSPCHLRGSAAPHLAGCMPLRAPRASWARIPATRNEVRAHSKPVACRITVPASGCKLPRAQAAFKYIFVEVPGVCVLPVRSSTKPRGYKLVKPAPTELNPSVLSAAPTLIQAVSSAQGLPQVLQLQPNEQISIGDVQRGEVRCYRVQGPAQGGNSAGFLAGLGPCVPAGFTFAQPALQRQSMQMQFLKL